MAQAPKGGMKMNKSKEEITCAVKEVVVRAREAWNSTRKEKEVES